MRLLLDSHAFLWFVLSDPRLSFKSKSLIEGQANVIVISPATCWEIEIKVSLGKLDLLTSFENFMDCGIAGNNFTMLPIELSHARRVSEFDKGGLHKDPFDRMLVAQALVEGIPLVSADTHLDAYGITRIW